MLHIQNSQPMIMNMQIGETRVPNFGQN